MRYTFAQCNCFFSVIHSYGVFIPPGPDKDMAVDAALDVCAARLLYHTHVLSCCLCMWLILVAKVGFARLARMSWERNLKLYKLRPKLHMMAEIALRMKASAWCYNPLSLACWSDEDYIGRVSRVSRSTHGSGLACSLDTMRRTLGMYAMQLERTFR